MKTTESKKTTTKATKATSERPAAKPKRVTAGKPEPDEEAVRRKAHEIYNERISRGESGTPEEDWYKAQKTLKKSKK
ncbi:MAG: hypothetical protein GX168_09325 [Bacteroidales bacterium]|jgi:hypothetical protein|nr:hypothetical protein [Bacteroidales bacterium]